MQAKNGPTMQGKNRPTNYTNNTNNTKSVEFDLQGKLKLFSCSLGRCYCKDRTVHNGAGGLPLGVTICVAAARYEDT